MRSIRKGLDNVCMLFLILRLLYPEKVKLVSTIRNYVFMNLAN